MSSSLDVHRTTPLPIPLRPSVPACLRPSSSIPQPPSAGWPRLFSPSRLLSLCPLPPNPLLHFTSEPGGGWVLNGDAGLTTFHKPSVEGHEPSGRWPALHQTRPPTIRRPGPRRLVFPPSTHAPWHGPSSSGCTGRLASGRVGGCGKWLDGRSGGVTGCPGGWDHSWWWRGSDWGHA